MLDAAMPALGAGKIVVDTSTIDPEVERAQHERVAATGARYLDAPLSGGTVGAERGTLTLMVGGDADALDAARPALDPFAGLIVHVGGPGMGQVVKLCNQLVYAAQMLAVAEATTMAAKAGVDLGLLYEVLTHATGDCVAVRTRLPFEGAIPDTPASNGWKPGFMTDLMAKDVDLALAYAAKAGVPALTSGLVRPILGAASAAGYGREDFSALGKIVRARRHRLSAEVSTLRTAAVTERRQFGGRVRRPVARVTVPMPVACAASAYAKASAMRGPTDGPTGVRDAPKSTRMNPPTAPGPIVRVASGSSPSSAARKPASSRTRGSMFVVSKRVVTGVQPPPQRSPSPASSTTASSAAARSHPASPATARYCTMSNGRSGSALGDVADAGTGPGVALGGDEAVGAHDAVEREVAAVLDRRLQVLAEPPGRRAHLLPVRWRRDPRTSRTRRTAAGRRSAAAGSPARRGGRSRHRRR